MSAATDARELAGAKRDYHAWLKQLGKSKVTQDDDHRDSVVLFVNRYVSARDLSPDYADRLRNRARSLAAFALTARMRIVFTEDVINRYLASLAHLAPHTIKCYRADLLCLWNGAADLDLVDYPRSRRIRRTKCHELVIECYTVDEAKAILAQARNLGPRLMSSGVQRRDYWTATILLAWDTGLRRGDVWAFEKSWLRPDGTARLVQRKTKQAVTVRLHPTTIAALNAIPSDQPCRWPGISANSPRFSKQFKAIARAAGVNRGTFKWLRRSSGSYVDMEHAGAGSKHLGHSCPQVFDKHYNGHVGGHTLPMPPDLDA